MGQIKGFYGPVFFYLQNGLPGLPYCSQAPVPGKGQALWPYSSTSETSPPWTSVLGIVSGNLQLEAHETRWVLGLYLKNKLRSLGQHRSKKNVAEF